MTLSVFIEIIGSMGVLCYVLSYALLQTGVISGNGYAYPAMNFGGAAGVAISLLNNWNMWSALTSLAFIIFSLIGFYRVFRANRALQFDARDTLFYETRFSNLRRTEMRDLLTRGRWRTVEAGIDLILEGKPVRYLQYIAEGAVEVSLKGKTIATLGQGELIGEMACLSKGLASASVRTTAACDMFEIPSDALNSMIKGKPDLRAEIEIALSGNVRDKLRQANDRLQTENIA